MKNKKIVIIGSYGCGNIGDNAILAGILNNLARKEYTFTVFCGDQKYIRNEFNVDTVCHLISNGMTLKALIIFLFNFFKALWCISRSKALIIGGGSLIHDLKIYNLPYYFAYHLFAKILKKKVIYCGIGVGPINTGFGKWLCRIFLAKSDYISVRDRHSIQLLNSVGVNNLVLTADQAFAMDIDSVITESSDRINKRYGLNKKNYITISVCGWFESPNFWKRNTIDFSSRYTLIKDTINFLYETFGMKIVFLATVYPYDLEAAKNIRELVNDRDSFVIINDKLEYTDAMNLIAGSYLVIGMRLHSLIFSTILAVPFFSLIYDKKVEAYLDSIGLSEFSCALSDADFKEVKSKVNRINECYDKISEQLKAAYINLRSSVLYDGKRINELI